MTQPKALETVQRATLSRKTFGKGVTCLTIIFFLAVTQSAFAQKAKTIDELAKMFDSLSLGRL